MEKLNTIYDDISFNITDRLTHLPQFVRDEFNENCRAIALSIINEKEFYKDGTVEENEQLQALCLLVQVTQSLIQFNNKFSGLLEIYNYLDYDLTEEIDKTKAKEIIENVFKDNYSQICEEIA